MTCEEVQGLLPEFLDGTLDSSVKEEVDRHLLTCSDCSRESSECQVLFKAMEDIRPVRPSLALKEHFLAMVQAEQKAQEVSKRREAIKEGKIVSMQWLSALGKVAVAAAILLIGVLIGYKANHGSGEASTKEIADLKNAVKDVKETMMINMLTNESASERIKAVDYTEDMIVPNQRVITALSGALNNDKSVNVRLAALYSLARFSDNRVVTDSLVSALSRQTEPIIQIVLINILGEKKETKAIQPIRDILTDRKTLKEVKDIARKELNKL